MVPALGCSGGGNPSPGAPDPPAATPDPPAAGCAVSASKRPLIERLVLDILRNAAWVADSSDSTHRGFALTPFGSLTVVGVLSSVTQCAGENIGTPICGLREPDIAPLTGCYRGRCERPGVSLEDAYVAQQGRTDPSDRHRVEYQSVVFDGRVVYDSNPFITYRVDHTGPSGPRVTADIDHSLSFTPPGSAPIDLSHAGHLTVTKLGGRIDRLALDLSFRGIAIGGPEVRLQLELDSNGVAAGSVSTSRGRIAAISGGDRTLVSGPVYAWEGECATSPASASP